MFKKSLRNNSQSASQMPSVLYNYLQYTSGKTKKWSDFRQDQIALISAFAYFLKTSTKN